MKPIIKLIISAITILSFSSIASAQTSDLSLIPEVQDQFKSNYSCTKIMKNFEQLFEFGKYPTGTTSINAKFSCATKNLHTTFLTQKFPETLTCPEPTNYKDSTLKFTENDILGCSIITGRIKFNYLPKYITYSLELLSILGGVLSLLFVILGGYWYLINGISGGDTDKGKTYIKNALLGIALSTSAWAIVNLVQIFFSS